MKLDWKPMSTAPEHDPILVWVPEINRGGDSIEVVIIIRDDPDGPADPSGRGYSIWSNGGPNGGIDLDFERDPTHWAPMPDGPEEEVR